MRAYRGKEVFPEEVMSQCNASEPRGLYRAERKERSRYRGPGMGAHTVCLRKKSLSDWVPENWAGEPVVRRD